MKMTSKDLTVAAPLTENSPLINRRRSSAGFLHNLKSLPNIYDNRSFLLFKKALREGPTHNI